MMNITNSWIKYTYPSLHILFSFSLYLIGEYTTLLVLQFGLLFLFISIKKNLYIFYIPLLFFTLSKLFTASFYPLYFFDLIFLYGTLFITGNLLTYLKLVTFTLYLVTLSFLYIFFEEQRYDFYLYINFIDEIHSFDNGVVGILIFLELLGLFFIHFSAILKKKEK